MSTKQTKLGKNSPARRKAWSGRSDFGDVADDETPCFMDVLFVRNLDHILVREFKSALTCLSVVTHFDRI